MLWLTCPGTAPHNGQTTVRKASGISGKRSSNQLSTLQVIWRKQEALLARKCPNFGVGGLAQEAAQVATAAAAAARERAAVDRAAAQVQAQAALQQWVASPVWTPRSRSLTRHPPLQDTTPSQVPRQHTARRICPPPPHTPPPPRAGAGAGARPAPPAEIEKVVWSYCCCAYRQCDQTTFSVSVHMSGMSKTNFHIA